MVNYALTGVSFRDYILGPWLSHLLTTLNVLHLSHFFVGCAMLKGSYALRGVESKAKPSLLQGNHRNVIITIVVKSHSQMHSLHDCDAGAVSAGLMRKGEKPPQAHDHPGQLGHIRQQLLNGCPHG